MALWEYEAVSWKIQWYRKKKKMIEKDYKWKDEKYLTESMIFFSSFFTMQSNDFLTFVGMLEL